MLVLALEFSRVCTAHAEAGTPGSQNERRNGNYGPTRARTG